MLKLPNLSARIGVKSLSGGAGAGAHFKTKQPNLSAKIGVKSLLGGAGAMLTKPVSQHWGKIVVPGWCFRPFYMYAAKPVSQDLGKVVVRECWRHFEATKPVSQEVLAPY